MYEVQPFNIFSTRIAGASELESYVLPGCKFKLSQQDLIAPACCKRGHYKTGKKTPLTFELELELIQTQMTQKPMLRAEVYAHAMRASRNRK